MSIDGLHRFKLEHGHGEVSYSSYGYDIHAADEGQVWIGARCGVCGETSRERVPVKPLLRVLMRLRNGDTDVGGEESYDALDDEGKLVHIMRKARKGPPQI